jgi:TrmH family RNA methyltransferase
VKYLSSLKLKKFRDENRQFIVEGNKLITDLLQKPDPGVILLAATAGWLESNKKLYPGISEVFECSETDLQRISSFDTPPPVIAVVPYHNIQPDYRIIESSISLALDSVQDPGNLGTIIRTADWFGIENIFCNEGCAERYNPKVIQASMGAIFNVKVHYTGFTELLLKISSFPDFPIIGTYISGEPVSALKGLQKGIIIFGNESKGISNDFTRFVNRRITIPSYNKGTFHVESLNVASSVAVALGITFISNDNSSI